MNISNGPLTKYYPLTHAQKRVWYVEKINPLTSLHNLGGSVRIHGQVDFDNLEKAIQIFIQKNEGIRLRFVEENGEARQYIGDYKIEKLEYYDFSTYENPEIEYERWFQEKAREVFQIEDSPLFYFALFKISEKENGYFMRFHHLVADGWSVKLVTDQVGEAYVKLLHGEHIDDLVADSYIDYIDAENLYLQSERFQKNKKFWYEKFKTLPEGFTNYNTDRIDGNRSSLILDKALSEKIEQFVAKNFCSLNDFFTTIWLLYLFLNKQKNDIIIGIPVANRIGKAEKNMFGMFTSTMPFRIALDENYSILRLLKTVKDELRVCYINQRYPYDLLANDLELRKKGYYSIFDTCVNYYNTRHRTEIDGMAVDNIEFYNGQQPYTVQLVVKDWSASRELLLHLDYKVSDYRQDEIDQAFNQLKIIITKAIDHPETKICELCLLSEDERNTLLYAFNNTAADYPKDRTITALFEEQVNKTPDKVVISYKNHELTFFALNQKANQLARTLRERGIKNDSIVGLLTTHSLETLIGILGILKAGGAYLPIDPNTPSERINYILRDSASQLVLTNIEIGQDIHYNGSILDLRDPALYAHETGNLNNINCSHDLAYLIYTSGSTGLPKGTLIEHQGLVNYIWWAKQKYVTDSGDTFALFSSLAFDLTVTSIFTPLVSGCRIIVYPDDGEEYVIYRILKDNLVTVLKLTPSQLSLLTDIDNSRSSLRKIIVGGEDLKVNLSKRISASFDNRVDIINEYGPTETVVGCMIHKYDPVKDVAASVPIGVPAHNVKIYILDKNMNPVPINTVGEIFISGDGLARGYLNRPELNQEKFLTNPFATGQRMYKTGDLARFISEHCIEYIRRADSQVKIHGYRIELGEIEKFLIGHDAVKQAVVIDHEDSRGNIAILAYFVKRSEISSLELTQYLSKYLPEYMVPKYFIELENIPLTSNGKVNRSVLPYPEYIESKTNNFIPFRNEIEEQLARIIASTLKVEAVSMNDNFYYLGGDSIKAIQISSKLNDLGLKLKVKDILSHPVIEAMALQIVPDRSNLGEQSQPEGLVAATPIISWFFSQDFADRNHYNQSIMLNLNKKVDLNDLSLAWDSLLRHHDSLSLNIKPGTDQLFYNNDSPAGHFSINQQDLASLSLSGRKAKISQIAESLNSSLNLENGPLIKACLFDLGNNLQQLFITIHHLAIDGISWRIILEDMDTILEQIHLGEAIKLPRKTQSFQAWAAALQEYSSTATNQTEFWQSIINNGFVFPVEHNSGEDFIKDSRTISAILGMEETRKLFSSANSPYRTEPQHLMITALLRTLKKTLGREEIMIELESHGRTLPFPGIDVSRTVGWFSSIFPFSLRFNSNELSDQIKSVKEKLRSVPDNGIGYGVLRYLSKVLSNTTTNYVRFNYLGDVSDVLENKSFQLIGSPWLSGSPQNRLTCLIDINCLLLKDGLHIHLTFSNNKFTFKKLDEFLEDYLEDLNYIINHCCNKESIELTPSDFETVSLSQSELDSLFI